MAAVTPARLYGAGADASLAVHAAAALARRGSWPASGGWDGAVQQGLRAWVAYAAYGDGIEVYEVGWTG